ncbi:uncharacterized protein LOC133899206 [Phragmites australis]|uniref:uncharacterized protein LOC133899206 n=1 Tax=Phragmites australis TaxID=29695 RepID=UPI002D7781F4|nr:uncharacterized protein LOC133899206 [Phragmites australis]
MIDDEADFNNILDAPAEVKTAAKFRPKQGVKPRKATLPSKSAAFNPTANIKDGKVGALTQGNSSEEISSQGRATLTGPDSETVDDVTGSRSILEVMSKDVLTVPLVPRNDHGVPWDSPTGGASAGDRVSQDDEHDDDSSKLATHQENLLVSDIHVSSASSYSKTIDDIVEFGEMFDEQAEEERVAKFQPRVQLKIKAASKSRKANQKVEASTVDAVTLNERGDNNQTGLHDDQLQAPRCHKSVQTSDSEALLATENSTVGNLANLDSVLEEPVQEETIGKFRPKLCLKPGKASSKVAGSNDNVAAATPMVGVCAVDVILQGKKDQKTITGPAPWSPQDVHANVDLDSQNELINPHTYGTQSMSREVSAEHTVKSQPNAGEKKGKGKSVSFVPLDASEGISPTNIYSDMGYFDHSCNDTSTDENLNNAPQQAAEKVYTDKESQSHEREPSDHAVEQQPKMNVGESGSSMKLRRREKLQKVGIPEHTADDFFDEDYVGPSAAEQDNDSGDDYTAGGKRKVRRKSRDGISKEPPRDSMCLEEPQQHKVQKDKSQVSSRGRKRTSKDAATEKPDKKLTHRIRQKKMKEVKTLLETSDNIDHMKLSATHLRLLQEIRERVKGKEIPSGPSSNTSFQLEDPDGFDSFGDNEAHNFDDNRTENSVLQNATKLNYHSYMNKQTRAKWSKSDTDLFYQGLRQFGSDFAMIQQLFPDKTCHQVRQKFKTEERKNPMQVHDAIIHRSGDNLFFKKVIKQLNIEDVLPEINSTHKQEDVSNEGGRGNENALDDFIDEEGENGSNWSDKELGTHRSYVQEEHVPGNADDDLGNVFDWY